MERLEEERACGETNAVCCPEHQKCFLLSIAPVLTRVKPSALISSRHCQKNVWQDQIEHVCETAGLSVRELYRSRKTFSLLVYDQYLMEERIRSAAAQELLCRYGYPADADLSGPLEHLESRFAGVEFPHEIGVFLGYPPEDVDAFIENRGRNYLCCRYWKVYHDEQGAREAFGSIDEAKARAAGLIARQIPAWEAAKILSGPQ
jgi:hypothetical protein